MAQQTDNGMRVIKRMRNMFQKMSKLSEQYSTEMQKIIAHERGKLEGKEEKGRKAQTDAERERDSDKIPCGVKQTAIFMDKLMVNTHTHTHTHTHAHTQTHTHTHTHTGVIAFPMADVEQTLAKSRENCTKMVSCFQKDRSYPKGKAPWVRMG